MFRGFERKDFWAFNKRKHRDPRYNAERRVVRDKMRDLQNDLNKELESRGFALREKVSQYWINPTKLAVEGIWLAYTEAEPYYIGSQLNCGIYEEGIFAGIEISKKAKADLNNVLRFVSNNPDEFLSFFTRLDPDYRLLSYYSFWNETPDISTSELGDLLNAMRTESDWFAFGEWYGKDDVSAKEIFMKSNFVTRVVNIFELLYPLYLVFSGRRPSGAGEHDKLLRVADVRNRDIARKERELAKPLQSFDSTELNRLIEEIDKMNRQKSVVSRRGITKTFRRNPVLSAALKTRYKDRCQICGVTFKTDRGRFFTDTHHLKSLRKSGTDTSDNIVVVCPNHHRILERSDVKVISKTKSKVIIEASGQNFEIHF